MAALHFIMKQRYKKIKKALTKNQKGPFFFHTEPKVTVKKINLRMMKIQTRVHGYEDIIQLRKYLKETIINFLTSYDFNSFD